MPGRYRFERFILDLGDRRLARDGVEVALNARYLDALALLVREQGRLVTKERFLDEVWAGVPVTDEALTQCIRTLRRQLDDDAASPRFIATVPKHGYRFLAAVEPDPVEPVEPPPLQGRMESVASPAWRSALALGAAGTAGGGAAGAIGGVAYGFVGAAQAEQSGAASVLLVMVILCVLVGLAGGLGVGFGIALAGSRPWWRPAIGGALGGLIVGAAFKLLGLDAFNLLLGRAPSDIAGAFEGLLLGGTVGLAAWLAARAPSPRRGLALAGLCGAATGALIPLLGGRLMAGSLDTLARSFPGSRLRLDAIGAVFGEQGLGLASLVLTGAAEGLLFGTCVVGAMAWARRAAARPAP